MLGICTWMSYLMNNEAFFTKGNVYAKPFIYKSLIYIAVNVGRLTSFSQFILIIAFFLLHQSFVSNCSNQVCCVSKLLCFVYIFRCKLVHLLVCIVCALYISVSYSIEWNQHCFCSMPNRIVPIYFQFILSFIFCVCIAFTICDCLVSQIRFNAINPKWNLN